ncbi:MAG: serine/threonine-protein kinase [Leptolyngbyaceae cyanobacterium bins.59]|nr:serine/threonine-protein kinase [Leptolyngbyaceae cyanobacterium bins.59]
MLEPGSILHDRYLLQRSLGQSRGRQVWLAKDQPQGRSVVVKLLTLGGDVQWEALKLFEREAQVLQQLEHPRIPKHRDYFSLDDQILCFGLVQDYIPGHSLKQLLESGKRFKEAEIRRIARELLAILVYLHGLNPPVLHRDIKPSNIILGDDQQLYLIDFGAVQDAAPTEGKTFTVVGTYGYAPIEQYGGRAVPASDLYALGTTLIHLLTGTPPADLPQDETGLKFRQQTNANPGFVRWLERMIQPSLIKRFTSAEESLKALKTGLNQQNTSLQSPESYPTIVRPMGSRIHLKKTPVALQIDIPAIGLPWIDWVKASLLLVVLSPFVMILLLVAFTSPLLLVVWLLVVWVCYAVLFPKFHPVLSISLVIDRKKLTLVYRFSQVAYLQREVSLSLIRNVVHYQNQGEGIVVVQSDRKKYAIGKEYHLSPHEAIWVAREIDQWLRQKE